MARRSNQVVGIFHGNEPHCGKCRSEFGIGGQCLLGGLAGQSIALIVVLQTS